MAQTELQLFAAMRYVDVVPLPAHAPNRIFLATRGALRVWIKAYPDPPRGKNRGEGDLEFIQSGCTDPSFVQYVGIFRHLATSTVYVETVYQPNGTLHTATMHNPLDEVSARVIFGRIFRGISSMHSLYIAHRQLSLEFILLDQNGSPRLAHFTESRAVTPPNMLIANQANPLPLDFRYTPPEMLGHRNNNYSYNPFSQDIWRAGVMLFRATTGTFPFEGNVNMGELLQRQQARAYHIPANLSASLVSLISSMLDPAPSSRPTIQQVIASPWFHTRM